MAERPIIFSTSMVRAILDGRKTQTRRVIKPQPDHTLPVSHSNGSITDDPIRGNRFILISDCPYGQLGDLLYVRETWREGSPLEKLPVYFKAGPSGAAGMKWKPSIHMPKKYARIWLKVEKIRVGRIQDISEQDAWSEGIDMPAYASASNLEYPSPRKKFAELWDSIYKSRGLGWKENPWVWVADFSVASTTGREGV